MDLVSSRIPSQFGSIHHFHKQGQMLFFEKQGGNIKDNCPRQHFSFPEHYKQGSD